MPGIEDIDKEYIPYIKLVVSILEKIINEDALEWRDCYKKAQILIMYQNTILLGSHWTLDVLDDTTKQAHILSLTFHDDISRVAYAVAKFLYVNEL